jgi:hypothetical protein
LPKRNEPKKRAAHCSPCGFPALLKQFGTRRKLANAQTLVVFDPNGFAMLGVAKGIKKREQTQQLKKLPMFPLCADE